MYSTRLFSFVSGGGRGGASFILPVTREDEIVNNLPIVIAPGGSGSAALERYSFLDQQVPRSDQKDQCLTTITNLRCPYTHAHKGQ